MSKYERVTTRLNRSYDCMMNACADESDPWKLLASAVIFQAAVDCQNWKPEYEEPSYSSSSARNGVRYIRRASLLEFIRSDWLDMLLCWQGEIKPEAVREELTRRLMHEVI